MVNSVLITGGAGFFGRAFARRVLSGGAERVCVYSRGEHAQALMREELHDERLRFFIGDVRDVGRLRVAMEGVELVVHAAALKRIEVGHYDPMEMVKTNIGGTINVIDAAHAAGVRRCVLVSSDKAWQPISPYGQTKALAETLFLNANNVYGWRGPRFAVCRYGNVAGSTGSVIPAWRRMLETGDAVPVSDPECTRFWMTIGEAVEFVALAAGDIYCEREVVRIPELPAFRLGDLAEAMGARMNVVGLPEWEKKHEGMRDGLTSDVARRMSVQELREALQCV